MTLPALLRQRHASRLLQVGLLIGFWQAGQIIVRWTGLPVPGGIIGMLLVLALLASGRISPSSMRDGAEWFLADMLLFFVPLVLAVLDHPEFLGWTGLKIMAVILTGTIVVMGATALAIDLCYRWIGTGDAAGHALD